MQDKEVLMKTAQLPFKLQLLNILLEQPWKFIWITNSGKHEKKNAKKVPLFESHMMSVAFYSIGI